MFRVRSLKVAMAVPAAVLLLAGCGGDEEPAEPAAQTQEAAPTSEAAPSAAQGQDDTAALEQFKTQLEDAAAQAGPEGFGALVCESVKVGLLTAESAGQEAAAQGLGQALDSILKGVNRSGDGAKEADVDATMKEQCPAVREDALKATGVNDLSELRAG